MTADVKLLPLPVRNYVDDDGLWETATGPYSAEETQAYARAVAEHNVKKRDAEIERLRAEVSELRAARIAYANEFAATEDGDPDTGNIHANIRALKARADDLAEALRELVEVFSESGMYDEEVFDKARAALEQEDV